MSKIIPSGGKRLVLSLISDVAKKMRMISNLAKRTEKRKNRPTGRMNGRGNFTQIPLTM